MEEENTVIVEETDAAAEQPLEDEPNTEEGHPLTVAQAKKMLADTSAISDAKYEKRFKDTQAALTRANQENAALRKRLDDQDAAQPLPSKLLEDRAEDEGWTAEIIRAYHQALTKEENAAAGKAKQHEPAVDASALEWQKDREEFTSANPKVDLSALDKHFEARRLSHADFYKIYQLHSGAMKMVPADQRKPITAIPKGDGSPPGVIPQVRSDMNAILAEMREEKKKKG